MDQVWNVFKSGFQFLSYPLFEISGHKISFLSMIATGIIFYGAILLSRASENLMRRILDEKTTLDSGVKDSINRFTRYTVLMVGGLVALDTVGISMSSLAALGAVLMVGIGFGLQNITQNFISGLIILLERPIKVGDLVEVEGVSGKVVDIRARSTIIHTRDDVAIIVPNSQFISEQVINESFSGEKIRLSVAVGVSYSSDPREIEKVLKEVATSHSKILKSPNPDVLFKNFGDSSLDFELRVWISELWYNEQIMSDLRFAISQSFKENNIEIPFPQRDLHLRSSASGIGLRS
jgi:small-conductance mechanosensitive channel